MTLYAKWTANTNTAYTIQHFQMDTNGNYPTNPTTTTIGNGTSDTTIQIGNIAKQSYTGCTYSHAKVGNVETTSTTIIADGSRVINLYYTRNQYTITYQTDSNTKTTKSVYYGSNALSEVSNPTKSGYTFIGWTTATSASSGTSTITSYNVTGIETLYALYQQTITLSYNGNGNTGGSTVEQTGTKYWNSAGNTTNPSFTLTNNGFSNRYGTFSKWAQGSTSGTQYSAGNTVTLSTNTTFYAIWSLYPDVFLYNLGPVSAYKDVTHTNNQLGSNWNWVEGTEDYFSGTGITYLTWNTAISNRYKYLKVSLKTEPGGAGTWHQLGFFVSNPKTTSYNDTSGIKAINQVITPTNVPSYNNYVIKTLDLSKVDVDEYYVGLWNCDVKTYFNKVWLTNTQ